MATTQTITAAALIAMPDDGHRYELIEGVLVPMAPAGMEHDEVGVAFARHLGNFVVPRGLGAVVGADTGFFLSRSPEIVAAPDAAFVWAERLPPRAERRGYLDLVPDRVVEGVSPLDRRPEVDAKVARYLAAGARRVWVAYPWTRTAAAHKPGRPVHVLSVGDVLDGGNDVAGFRLPVTDVFAD